MKRREFIKKSVTGAAAATVLTGCNKQESSGPAVITRKKVMWRLASSYPASLETIFGAAKDMAARVAELTDGDFTIRVFSAGEIVPGLQVLDGVQQGAADMGHSASYYYIGKNQAFAFDTCVPFGLTGRQQMAWLYQGGGLDLMNELFADFNVMTFPGGNTGVQMGGWFRREIGSLADLKGLKMRIPGLGGKVMSDLGVTVQVLPGGEIFPALDRGAIDAAEWVGPYDDEKLGLHEAAKYYYYPGWWEPGPNLSYYINRDRFAQLPSSFQAALKTAMAESGLGMLNKYDVLNPPALARIQEKGIELRRFSNDIMKAAEERTVARFEELAAGDAAYRKVYDAWKTFRIDSYRWFGTSEMAFSEYAFPSA